MSARAALFCLALAPGAAHACWEQAAARYNVNPQLLYAIAKTESGLNPLARNRNKNGSYDVGLMQINSSWLPRLRQFGLDEQQLLEPCTSIQVGAWILAQNMQRLGNSWDAIGAYNSSKPALRLKYALRVYQNIPPAALQQRASQ
ncbi:lytic transglycosylase domain-containing protein [Rugamonas rubra]|jgi:soluble lytic murein transglycosylase-like protein|uniref:Transglycosylase SLT domain-containing protein n=1 Tax=Rugamonas rubra TaxID=758825 RepID=A0A1I4M5C1_9BURK|nr:lytic transglycosylase domain-containing protein [Rugamonas rubra]SFL98356.1 Transglycosylase SLT domain-containing protein [Rugamonas rubra]